MYTTFIASTGKTIYCDYQLSPLGSWYYVYGIDLLPIEKDEVKNFIRKEGDPISITFTKTKHDE